MYGRPFSLFTLFGSTGKRLIPPAFCQSAKERDLKEVMPTLPRSLPFAAASLALIFFHCSFDTPLGMYSIVMEERPALRAPFWNCWPLKEEKASASGERATAAAMAKRADFMVRGEGCGGGEGGSERGGVS
jgi:hypothetical protein